MLKEEEIPMAMKDFITTDDDLVCTVEDIEVTPDKWGLNTTHMDLDEAFNKYNAEVYVSEANEEYYPYVEYNTKSLLKYKLSNICDCKNHRVIIFSGDIPDDNVFIKEIKLYKKN